jgi:hypothetical protein
MTAIGLLALMPVMVLNIRNDAQFGASAHAMVKRANITNVGIMITLRPYVSDNGPKITGPTMYPMRYMDMGKI